MLKKTPKTSKEDLATSIMPKINKKGITLFPRTEDDSAKDSKRATGIHITIHLKTYI